MQRVKHKLALALTAFVPRPVPTKRTESGVRISQCNKDIKGCKDGWKLYFFFLYPFISVQSIKLPTACQALLGTEGTQINVN